MRQAMFSMVAVVFLNAFTAGANAVDQARRDGNWWLPLAEYNKNVYMIGFFDGMDLGNTMSLWSLLDESDFDAYKKAYGGYTASSLKYFGKATSKQIADGLDELYRDPRNRSILVSDGVWLVVNQIVGAPDEQMEKMILNYRRAASE